MEPRIQYAKTKDGVNIAFSAVGKGAALVHMMAPGGYIQQQWEVPEYRAFYERLAQKRMLVQYDVRGIGLSQRDVVDFSLEAVWLDLEAVVGRLGLERLALWATQTMGPVAIAYAARHPERVSRLILWHSYVRASDFLKSPEAQAVRRLIDDWELYTATLAHYVFGWPGGEAAHHYAARMREGVPAETYRALMAQLNRVDVTDLLPQVRAPTLVLHRRQFRLLSADVATELASRIPNARLVLLEGESGGFALEDSQAVLDAAEEFLAEEEAPPSKVAEGLQTILLTDMEGSTALTQRLGDAKAQEVLRTHNAIVREALKAHGGGEIKHTGDGIMASFTSASRAIECAIGIQKALAQRNASLSARPEPVEGRRAAHGSTGSPRAAAEGAATVRVRIGLNAGEPVAEDEDLFGTAVQATARICARAQPGQILAADVVRQLVAGKGFAFADRGRVALKGFPERWRLWEVSSRDG